MCQAHHVPTGLNVSRDHLPIRMAGRGFLRAEARTPFIESPLVFADVLTRHEPSSAILCGRGHKVSYIAGRGFMESPLFHSDLLTGHEPRFMGRSRGT
jgi:hypothetical protein